MSKFKSILLLGAVSMIWIGTIGKIYGCEQIIGGDKGPSLARQPSCLRNYIRTLDSQISFETQLVNELNNDLNHLNVLAGEAQKSKAKNRINERINWQNSRKENSENRIKNLKLLKRQNQEELENYETQMKRMEESATAAAKQRKTTEGNATIETYIAEKKKIESQIKTEEQKKKQQVAELIAQLNNAIKNLSELKTGQAAAALKICDDHIKLIEDLKNSKVLAAISTLPRTPGEDTLRTLYQELSQIFSDFNGQLETTKKDLESSMKKLVNDYTYFESWVKLAQNAPLKVQSEELQKQSNHLETLTNLQKNYISTFEEATNTLKEKRIAFLSSVSSTTEKFFSQRLTSMSMLFFLQRGSISTLKSSYSEEAVQQLIIPILERFKSHATQ